MNVQSLIKLDKKKINFSPASVVDDFGRVFFYEGRVFRAIDNGHKENCLNLLKSSLFKELTEEHYIPRTWISEFRLEDHELVLEHERLHESKVHHWSFTMFKDAALFIIELNRRCNQYGYRLKDAHPFNVFFDQNKPIFVDLGSIIQNNSSISWGNAVYEEFINTYFIPLLFWSRSEYFMARRLIEDGILPTLRTIPMKKVLDSEFLNPIVHELFEYKLYIRKKLVIRSRGKNLIFEYATRAFNKMACLVFRRTINPFLYLRALKPCTLIESRIRDLSKPPGNTAWGDYHNSFNIGSDIVSTPRFDRLIQLVNEYASDSKTALDLAGNQGVFSYLLYRKIKLERVVLTDYDETAIDKAYKTFRKQSINIEAYLFNFMKPLRPNEILLFKSDVVFALAITHHLILKQRYILPVVFDRISQFSKKYVIVEFMPLGLWSPGSNPDVPKWYNIDWFRSEFEQFFETLTEEQLAKNRIVFVGRKLNRD